MLELQVESLTYEIEPRVFNAKRLSMNCENSLRLTDAEMVQSQLSAQLTSATEIDIGSGLVEQRNTRNKFLALLFKK